MYNSDKAARRTQVRISRLEDQGEETEYLDTTVEDRIGMMWQLALDAWAFMGEPVEPRLPRHGVRIYRGGRLIAQNGNPD